MESAKVVAATKALQKYVKLQQEENSTGKADLFDETNAQPIYLVVKAKRYLAEGKNLRPKLAELPHSIYGAERPSICLFSRDPQRAYKDALIMGEEDQAKLVDRVVGISKLKGKFQRYEARRNLKSQFDLFLCEKEVVNSLPSMLGKSFYATVIKTPIAIRCRNDKTNEIDYELTSQQIEKVLKSTPVMKTGSTVTSVRIGTTDSKPKQISENAAAVLNFIAENLLEEGMEAIRQVEIKTPHSISLPVYYTKQFYTEQDIGTEADNIEEKESVKRKREEAALDELLKEIADEDEIKAYNREERKKRRGGYKATEAETEAETAVEATEKA